MRPIGVTVADTDGAMSAVSGEELTEGLEVVTGEMRRDAQSNVVNPLLPQMQGKKKS